MKLSHRDFRPSKRSKYVSLPRRKRPALRILILIAFGVLVYVKFDSFVKSKAVQALRRPGRLWEAAIARIHPQAPAAAPRAEISRPDSSSLDLACASPSPESCLSAWAVDEETRGWARALVLKASLAAGATRLDGFSLRLRRRADDPDSGAWALASLEIRAGSSAWTLEPGRSPGEYCLRGGGCLGSPLPRAPVREARQAVPEGHELAISARAPAPVFPALPGRIVEVTQDSAGCSVEIYHGTTLFTAYRGLGPCRGIRAGLLVRAGDTLGYTAASGAPLRLRVERDGMPMDASAFLGLMAADASAENRGGQ